MDGCLLHFVTELDVSRAFTKFFYNPRRQIRTKANFVILQLFVILTIVPNSAFKNCKLLLCLTFFLISEILKHNYQKMLSPLFQI